MSITMQEFEELGFEIVKSYTHDHFITQRRRKGQIQVETTWRKGDFKQVSQDIMIDETYLEKFNKSDLKFLDSILNNTDK